MGGLFESASNWVLEKRKKHFFLLIQPKCVMYYKSKVKSTDTNSWIMQLAIKKICKPSGSL